MASSDTTQRPVGAPRAGFWRRHRRLVALGIGGLTFSTQDAGAEPAAGGAESSARPPEEAQSLPAWAPIQLRVDAGAPYQNWLVTLTNATSRPLQLPWDPRLLWLEVRVPGSRSRTRCRLPDAMRPSDSPLVSLAAGVEAAFEVDPRFYCFASGDQTALVPGAFIEAHYGYPSAQHRRWVNGRVVEQPLANQKAPFLLPEAVHASGAVKEVVAPGFALDSSYRKWAKTRLKDERWKANGPPLRLWLSRATDSHNATDAGVAVTLTNVSTSPVSIYYYREGITFTVVGPDGGGRCGGTGALRAPTPEQYTSLKPGGSKTFSMRLSELCGRDLFAQPGYYLVSAYFTTKNVEGQGPADAFYGVLQTAESKLVRVQTGPAPYVPRPPIDPADASRLAPPGPPPSER